MFWPRWRPHQETTRWKAARVYALVVLCLAALPVDAVDIRELEVSESSGVYLIKLATVIRVQSPDGLRAFASTASFDYTKRYTPLPRNRNRSRKDPDTGLHPDILHGTGSGGRH